MPAPAWLKLLASAPPVPAPPPPPGSGGPINVVGNIWTPARDGQGNVLVSDFEALPLGQTLYVAGTIFSTNDGSIMEFPFYPGHQDRADGRPRLFNNWSGAARSDDNASIWIRGGGHAGTHICDNGIYRWDMHTLRPVRVRNRSALNAATGWNGTQVVNFDTGEAVNPVLLDGQVGAVHTYYGDVWLPPSVYGNTSGGLVLMGWAHATFNLDTNTQDTPRFKASEVYQRSFANTNTMRVGNTVWWQDRGLLWYEFDPNGTSVTDWSPTSRGAWTGRLVHTGATELASGDRKFLVRMPVQGWWFVIDSVSGPKLFKLGDAIAAMGSAQTFNGSAHVHPITLTSADGSHADLLNPNRVVTQAAGGTGEFTNCAAAYDAELDAIFVWSNRVGGSIYRLSGVSAGYTWTCSRVVASAALADAEGHPANGFSFGYGTYDRSIYAKKGSARVFARLTHTSTPAEICRVA